MNQVKSILNVFRGLQGACSLTAGLAVLVTFLAGSAHAQPAQVPSQYQSIYSSLNTYLTNFNTTLNSLPASQTPTYFTGNLKNADSNAGPQLVNPGSMQGIQLQLQELKAIGVGAVMVEVGFPMLYEPFLTSQGQTQAQWTGFYQQIASMVHGAGLKLVVENDTLLVNDVQAGWDAAPFYATLNWTQYQQARAQTALTIAQTMQPDFLILLQEPQTEYDNSLQTNVNTPSGSYAMLSQLIASVQQAGVPGMQIGAGTGTAQTNALSFIQQYVTLPLNFIDFHIYPVNGNNLPIALQIVNTAAAAGLPVGMTEYWLWKVADSELGVLSDDTIRARNPFTFWEPLDSYFLQTMQNLARHSNMLFQNPFDSESFAAYLPYNSSFQTLSSSSILSQESAQASQNLNQAIYSPTAYAYYGLLVSPADTTPPSVPTGLSGNSANPTTDTLNWVGSSDNIGVAGYNVFRNGVPIGTTASANYQDSGLTESTTYSYAVQAFDLGGNTSSLSQAVHVTTADVTPPSAPSGLTATPISCQRVTLNWTPASDNVGVGSYLVFWGISPSALTQVGRTSGSNTTFSGYPVSAGTTYYYGIEAVDTSGNVSAMSVIVSVTTPMPPSAPTGVKASATSTTSVSVTWTAAVGGGLPIQNYHVFRGTSAGNLAQVAIVLQNSYNDNSASPSGSYYYAIEAADSGADLSPMSAVVSVTTPASPGAPTNVLPVPASSSRIGLTWSPSISGGLPIQNYHVYRGATSSSLVQVAVVLQTSYNDTAVNAGATYYYAVTAADSGNDLSAMSVIAAVVVPSAPGAPTALAASPISTIKIGLSWSPSISGGLPIQNYRIFRGAAPSSMTQLATTGQTAYTDASASPSSTYYYAIQAADTGNDLSAMSATVSVTSLALPSAPTNVAVTALNKSQVSLTWMAAQSGMPLSSYTIFRGSSPSSLTSLKVVAANQTSATDSSVAPNVTYYYGIQSKDTLGNTSPMSAVVSVTTP